MKARYGNLKEYLDEKGWTEARAAEHFGCSIPTISRVLNRQRKPNGPLAVKMAAAGIDVNYHFEAPRVAS